ncbi:GNAT family N-acetyltransferase [Bacillus sp. FJAT-47783]|uniref:GNAT family N-acetyltransferase n=1 Tax=Bacillus sp. FJAT-47783 TaxID=2922712 RepID=UPI001FADBC2E|nr:GNAT family N-acetyltransferase [Bacillus sp. FJAT-47783]
MIRQLTEQDYEICYSFVSEKPSENLFIIGDIEAFGFEQDFQKLWGEFDNAGNLVAVLLKYYDNYIAYAPGDFNAKGFAQIINEDPQFAMISGLEHTTRNIHPYINTQVKKKRALYYAKLDALNQMENSYPFPEVKELKVEEVQRLMDLYKQIPEFENAGRDGGKGHKNSMEKGVARTYYIERDGEIVSAASTTAENSQSAMIVGVCTLKAYKRKGMATTILTKLCTDMLNTGRTLCLFYDNPDAGTIYKRIGFQDIGKWMMYSYEKKLASIEKKG